MTRRAIDLDQVRVVSTTNYKGNPRLYLEIMDTRVLYADPGTLDYLPMTDNDGDDADIDTEALADMFRHSLARVLAKLILEDRPDLAKPREGSDWPQWTTDTDREIDYIKPRLEEDRYL